ncbi:unnamed protein product [Adineta ricciae]|uniref:Caspase family p20 domain-containing protein n=1 Tax=Adineta ricciae TaxID=249248 RepID=A0A815QXA8_ADIRI|nr:unnamed protein product [Adineta ricciae]
MPRSFGNRRPCRKIALVIGNADYEKNPLRKPLNDAADMTKALKSIGFQGGVFTDMNFGDMKECTKQFVQAIQHNDLVLFYFSGHGKQWEDHNFLLPCNNRNINDSNISQYAINAQWLLEDISKRRPHAIVFILDCSREYVSRDSAGHNMKVHEGEFEQPRSVPKATCISPSIMICYACQGGESPVGNNADRNSMYTKHILRHIATPRKQIQDLFIIINNGVREETREAQEPSTDTSLKDPDIYLCDADCGGNQSGSNDDCERQSGSDGEDQDQGGYHGPPQGNISFMFCLAIIYARYSSVQKRITIRGLTHEHPEQNLPICASILVREMPRSSGNRRPCRKIALVIGNAAYERINKLGNSSNDAVDMGKALKSIGFQVDTGIDLKLGEMASYIKRFVDRIEGDHLALFFFAGHGSQLKDQNYLIPTDYSPSRGVDSSEQAINAQIVLREMRKRNPFCVVFLLDCCRNFDARPQELQRGATIGSRGIGKMNARGNTIIGFGAKPGKSSGEYKSERNGHYTKHLLEHIATPNMQIQDLFTIVTKEVAEWTNGDQEPWQTGSLRYEDIYLCDGDAYSNDDGSAESGGSDHDEEYDGQDDTKYGGGHGNSKDKLMNDLKNRLELFIGRDLDGDGKIG